MATWNGKMLMKHRMLGTHMPSECLRQTHMAIWSVPVYLKNWILSSQSILGRGARTCWKKPGSISLTSVGACSFQRSVDPFIESLWKRLFQQNLPSIPIDSQPKCTYIHLYTVNVAKQWFGSQDLGLQWASGFTFWMSVDVQDLWFLTSLQPSSLCWRLRLDFSWSEPVVGLSRWLIPTLGADLNGFLSLNWLNSQFNWSDWSYQSAVS